jgi:hypothetical protein
MLTAVPDCLPAGSGTGAMGTGAFRPWSYRIAGATSAWPAVEVYEAGSLLDVVTSTRLIAQVVRGSRAADGPGGRHVIAWGRLPLSGGLPSVEFGRSRRGSGQRAQVLPITSWCWLAVAEGHHRTVTVRYGGACIRRRLGVSKPCR